MRRTSALAPIATILVSLSFVGNGSVEPHRGGDEALRVTSDPVDFTRQIRPILSDRCFQCHGPDVAERKAGLRLDIRDEAVAVLPSGRRAIVPGAPEKSALVSRVAHADPKRRMPPAAAGRTPLTESERALLKRWIAEGANYETHWSFTTPARPPVPAVADSGWVRNPIDAFVRAEQERRGMNPAPEASAEALARRSSFDLNGLPPSPAEVTAFEKDKADGRFQRHLERLLKSPRYGEHMARHWLDAARYGDTHGLHLDNERSMWPYREWVIEAFNRNLPYDRFVVEQLAGDLLPEPTLEQRVATGFNRCNVTSAEGGMIATEYLALYAMDRVDTTSTVFLGLTMACAKCHDHKFDPLSQREYYEFFAFFNSITEEASDRNAIIAAPAVSTPTDEQEREFAELTKKIADAEAAMAAPAPEIDAAQATWEEEARRAVTTGWVTVRPTGAYSAAGATMTIGADRIVRASGKSPERDAYEIVGKTHLRDIKAIRLELLPDPEQPGGGVGRGVHNNIVLTHLEITAAPLENGDQKVKVAVARASADWNQRDFPIRNALDADPASGWAIFGAAAEDRLATFSFEEPISYVGGTEFRIKLGFGSAFAQHTIARLRLSVTDREEKTPSSLGTWYRCEQSYPAGSAKEAFDTAWPPEKDAGLKTRYDDGKHGWVAAPEYVDEKVHLFSQLPRRAYYVQRIIEAPSKRRFSFFVGSDDAVKVFLNGDEIHARDVRRGVAADQDRLSVELRRGTNRILIKIINDGGACGFYFRAQGENIDGVPASIARILRVAPGERGEDDTTQLRTYYRRNHSDTWRQRDKDLRALKERKTKLAAAYPRTMVMQEMKTPRDAFMLRRGQYDQPGDKVAPGVPAVFPPLPEGAPKNRLALARWIVDPAHPLTARVFVNRLWQMVFGQGLVTTPEDFGSQGALPTHPELLDWLAVEFVESGWDIQHMLRLMMTSSTYRQATAATDDARTHDATNSWLARGARHRLDAEQLRDAALHMSGLLVERIGGPSVRPYQPLGVWRAVGYTSSNTANFRQGKGDDLWRRSLYTFWKRTAPPPTMSLFDAPSREACSVKRARTNTPLQALALLNDVQFVEAARGFGARALAEGGDTDAARLTWMWRWATSRSPRPDELEVCLGLLATERRHYAGRLPEAKALVEVGESKLPEGVPHDELAAWASVANMLLNLDETLTRG